MISIRQHFTNFLGFSSVGLSSGSAVVQPDAFKADILWTLSVIVATMTIIHLYQQITNRNK